MTTFVLVVPFAGLAPVVDEWRERTCVTKPSHGVVPHVTLLTPAPDDVAAITRALSPFTPFEVEFRRLDRFPGTLWFAPEPAEPFRAITETLVAHFPGHQPYGGAFEAIIPHLTVAQAELDDAAAALEPELPLRSYVDCVLLLERVQGDHWREVAHFDLEAD